MSQPPFPLSAESGLGPMLFMADGTTAAEGPTAVLDAPIRVTLPEPTGPYDIGVTSCTWSTLRGWTRGDQNGIGS